MPLPATDHDRSLAAAFDGQAARFERATVQNDPAALERLVRWADFPPDSSVLDAGCGPGLVAEALLRAGHRVLGIDLSAEMIARARKRCEPFGERVRFEQGSLFEARLTGSFDAAISRSVLHHLIDPLAFVRRQVELLRPGGVLVACDHTTDPDPALALWNNGIEQARDRTHTRCLSPGGLLDLLAQAGLDDLRFVEEPFTLDFDEWFDRGTPAEPKEAVRARLMSAPCCRGFQVEPRDGGAIRIQGRRAIVRGIKP
jgi:SAM-dependent methyltransferase